MILPTPLPRPQAPTANELALDSICRKLQLDITREQVLATAYESLTGLIEKNAFFDGHTTLLYAYGSRPIGTVVKPKRHEEYDLDFAAQIDDDYANYTPFSFRQKLFDCLDASGIYSGKLELIRFGVRINYASQLHIDIMPVCRMDDSGQVWAPDCKYDRWVPRNLKGYVRWFESNYIQDIRRLPLFERYQDYGLIEARAETEQLPVVKPYVAIQPLQKAVQLIKRFRNIHFEQEQDLATSSIILTTLVGNIYKGELTIERSVGNVLAKLLNERMICKRFGKKLKVYNPADSNIRPNGRELLSSKWEEADGQALYGAFWDFIATMNDKWFSLELASTKKEKVEILKGLFGEHIGNELIEERSIWGEQPISDTPYNMPHVTQTAAKATPWRED